jgi:hypothetical protein
MNSQHAISLIKLLSNNLLTKRSYAKKAAALTDAQIQFQKHTAELGFRERVSIRGTKFEFNDVDTSIQYMKSEGWYFD